LAMASVCTVGVMGYVYLGGSGEKQPSELVFFCALVAAIALLVLFVLLVHHARRRTRALQRLIAKVGAGGYIARDELSAFGEFGSNIMALVKEIQDVSDKRSQRIKYLNSALGAIMADSEKAVLLLDAAGTISMASPEFFSKCTKPEEQGGIYGSNVERFGLEEPFPQLAQEMSHSRDEMTVTTDEWTIRFIPIFGTKSLPDGFFAFLQKANVFSKVKDKVLDLASGKEKGDDDAEEPSPDEAAKKTGSIFGRMKSMFGKKTE
ncbi:MAG: hypothetical protein J1E59_09430, partial [Treponema sp.]|nr:hypothetical protein [Treponema sp.]